MASGNYGKRVLKNVIFFLLVNSSASEFYMPTFRNTLSVPSSWAVSVEKQLERKCWSIYTGKSLVANCMSKMEEGGKTEGASPCRGTGCGGQRPQGGACSYVTEKRSHVGARKGNHGMVEIKLLRFRMLSPFFKHVQKGFPGFA